MLSTIHRIVTSGARGRNAALVTMKKNVLEEKTHISGKSATSGSRIFGISRGYGRTFSIRIYRGE